MRPCIVPFAPGGQNDAIGRLIAQKLSENFGKQYIIENVGGGGGVVGTARAGQAAPDGYTLLVMDTGFVINPFVYPKVPYDPFKDFEPVSIAVTTTQVLTVTPSLPVQSVKELVALVKANPGKYSYASPGIGTPGHMTAELFRLSLGLDLVHVPFNGAGPAVASTIGGHTPIAFGSPASSVAQVKDGKLRGLAVASGKRLVALPDLPTMAQAGFPDIDVEFWIGIFAPASTPKDIVVALNREVDKAVALPDVRQRSGRPRIRGSRDRPCRLRREAQKRKREMGKGCSSGRHSKRRASDIHAAFDVSLRAAVTSWP